MIQNPYIAAMVRQAETAQKHRPPCIETDKPLCPEKVQSFFDAMDIPHRGNRARICTARAHEMTSDELREAIKRLTTDQKKRLTRMIELKAPKIILSQEENRHAWAIGILQRILDSR